MLKQSNGARGSSSVVECHLAKVDVASSNLVYRSSKQLSRFGKLFFFYQNQVCFGDALCGRKSKRKRRIISIHREEETLMKKKMLRWLLLCMLLCCASCAKAGQMEVMFFNAGKADACLLRTENSTVLIDTGKNKFGKEIVSWLQANGISEIDVMFITHFDKDHVGGADAVLEAVRVHQIYEPAYESDSKQYVQYREALAAAGLNAESLEENIAFELDGVRYVVDVANSRYYGEDEENDFSLVIGITHGENSFLMAGDAENPRLLELLEEGIGAYDVLKVPHHGREEKASAAFFAAVKPAYAIITSDEDDLEDDSVVYGLRRYGQVYLTRYGAVRVVSDGQSLLVEQK